MKNRLLFWSTRILAILAILFFFLFSFDCFGGGSVSKQITCFLMSNIPAFILIVILLIAWKHEMIGGVLFIAAMLAGSFFFRVFTGNPGALIVLSPLLLVGILFILQDGMFRGKNDN
jgi:hypothetical protein